jgi:hypothetical protein
LRALHQAELPFFNVYKYVSKYFHSLKQIKICQIITQIIRSLLIIYLCFSGNKMSDQNTPSENQSRISEDTISSGRASTVLPQYEAASPPFYENRPLFENPRQPPLPPPPGYRPPGYGQAGHGYGQAGYGQAAQAAQAEPQVQQSNATTPRKQKLRKYNKLKIL